MSLRRLTTAALRNCRPRGGGWPGGSFWSEGTQTGRNGYLFGETPPPNGAPRKWETWELPWYLGWGAATAMAVTICYGVPDTSLKAWARPHALAELREEEEAFGRLFADAGAAAQARAAMAARGLHADLHYDEFLSRREFDVLKAAAHRN
jgi:hypothetical protein